MKLMLIATIDSIKRELRSRYDRILSEDID